MLVWKCLEDILPFQSGDSQVPRLNLLFVWSWGGYLPVDRGCRMMAQTEMKTETSINSFSEEGCFFSSRGEVFFLCLYIGGMQIYQMTKMVLSNWGGRGDVWMVFISWVPYYCSYFHLYKSDPDIRCIVTSCIYIYVYCLQIGVVSFHVQCSFIDAQPPHSVFLFGMFQTSSR